MVPILMQRGYNSLIYYVKRSETGSDQAIKELNAHIVCGTWVVGKKTIHKITEGSFLALEMDPENTKETDSIYTYDRDLIETREEVLNRLYVLADHEDIHLLVQDR